MELAITQVATDLNPVVGDLQLDAAGQPILLTSLAAEVAQRIFVRLNFFKGEWFLNLEEGTPYYEEILRKGSDRAVRSVLGRVIRTTQGVSELTQFRFSRSADRTITIVFKARLTDGTTFNSADFGAFVV